MVPFKVGDLAGMRLVRVVPGVAAQFTDGPKDTLEATEQPHLVIAASPGGPAESRDRDQFARDAMSGLPPFKDLRIINAEPMRIGGQPGHEVRAQAKDPQTGADIEIVQWLRFGTGAYLRILGFASEGQMDRHLHALPRRPRRPGAEVDAPQFYCVGLSLATRGDGLGAALGHRDQRRPQHPIADQIAGLHHLDDAAGRHAGVLDLVHRLMTVGIELLAERLDPLHAVLFQHVHQLALGQLDAFEQRLGRLRRPWRASSSSSAAIARCMLSATPRMSRAKFEMP